MYLLSLKIAQKMSNTPDVMSQEYYFEVIKMKSIFSSLYLRIFRKLVTIGVVQERWGNYKKARVVTIKARVIIKWLLYVYASK